MANCYTSARGCMHFSRPITPLEFNILARLIELAQSGETAELESIVPSPEGIDWEDAADVQYVEWRNCSNINSDWLDIAYAEQGNVQALAAVVQVFCIVSGLEFALFPVSSEDDRDGGSNSTYFVTAKGGSECSGPFEAEQRAIAHLSRKRWAWALLDWIEQWIVRLKRQVRVNFEYTE